MYRMYLPEDERTGHRGYRWKEPDPTKDASLIRSDPSLYFKPLEFYFVIHLVVHKQTSTWGKLTTCPGSNVALSGEESK